MARMKKAEEGGGAIAPVTAAEIDEAFEAAPHDEALQASVNRNISAPTGAEGTLLISEMPDSDLAMQDDAINSRLLYATSTLRLLDTLRREPADFDASVKQGTLAMAYLRHADNLERKAEKIDPRKSGDKALTRAVAKVRGQIDQLAEYKQRNPRSA